MIRPLLLTAYAAVLAGILAVALTNLRWIIDAWRSPDRLAARGFEEVTEEPLLSFSLLVPARHEEAVLGETLRRLAEMDHPCFEIVVIIGHDDDGTRAVAEEAVADHPDRIWIVTDHNWPKNKPKAMNTALPFCRGDVIGVFDAEDGVSPQLLRKVDHTFRRTGAHVVQGGVQLMNFRSTWFTLRNVLEYFFYFGSTLRHHAHRDFVPLGGNTVFFRRDALEMVGGWDGDCLAEDCEVGVRLSSRGARTAVLYDPAVATREEAPTELRAFFKQRTRWNQGFLQVLRKGEWRRLPTLRSRLFARYLLLMPFLQAATLVVLPFQLLSILFVDVPIVLAMASFVPLMVLALTVAFEAVGLADFGRMFGERIRVRDYLRLTLSTFVYHFVLAGSAARAIVREVQGSRGWEKTAHTGAHRSGAPATQGAPS